MNDKPAPTIVDRKEACRLYSVSDATLRRAVADGSLRAKSLGGRLRFRLADLETWYSQLEDA